MGGIKVTGDRFDARALESGEAGPTASRMLVGAYLRRLREARGITREDAGYEIRASQSKMSRLELGRTGFKLRDVADLLTMYGVTDEAERATVLAVAEQANAPGWWHSYSDVSPSWSEPYLGLEQAASVIRVYEGLVVPGLLQTPDYARAALAVADAAAPKERVDRLVRLRTRRQEILRRPDPPRLWAVLDEAVLRRPMGGAETMRAQLRHLIEACSLTHVTVQVMPFHAGGYAAAGGPFTLLRFPEYELPDVVYLEHLNGACYPDRPSEIDYYRHLMNRLVTEAEQSSATLPILRRILEET
ncbi:MAG: Helix-turn-helix protein [Sphaerisporangium sp.]|nr:Helix-turn-helix protein [Sphaerisporangium sp.]